MQRWYEAGVFIAGLSLGALLCWWLQPSSSGVKLAEMSVDFTASDVAELCQQIEQAPAAIVVFPSLIRSLDQPDARLLGPKFEMAIKLPPIKEGTVSDAVADYLVHVVEELSRTGVNRWRE